MPNDAINLPCATGVSLRPHLGRFLLGFLSLFFFVRPSLSAPGLPATDRWTSLLTPSSHMVPSCLTLFVGQLLAVYLLLSGVKQDWPIPLPLELTAGECRAGNVCCYTPNSGKPRNVFLVVTFKKVNVPQSVRTPNHLCLMVGVFFCSLFWPKAKLQTHLFWRMKECLLHCGLWPRRCSNDVDSTTRG